MIKGQIVAIANYGNIVVDNGQWYFEFDSVLHSILEKHGLKLPVMVSVEPMWCNPTPPFLPTVGGFIHPQTGYYCHPKCIQKHDDSIRKIGRQDMVFAQRCKELYQG